MCFKQKGAIFTQSEKPLKLVDQCTYLGSNIPSTESDVIIRLTKGWNAIGWLLNIWKSYLSDKFKRYFFEAVAESILLYGCTTWTKTKHTENKIDRNSTRMLHAVLKKYISQHPTKKQLYSHLPPISQSIQASRTRHAGHCWRSKDELVSDILL